MSDCFAVKGQEFQQTLWQLSPIRAEKLSSEFAVLTQLDFNGRYPLTSSGVSGGCLHGGASFKVEKALGHFRKPDTKPLNARHET